MRLLFTALALASVIGTAASVEARDRRSYDRKYWSGESSKKTYRRSSTEDREGRCVRDNGRPMGSLDLNHRCDIEEFWARFNDFGNGRR